MTKPIATYSVTSNLVAALNRMPKAVKVTMYDRPDDRPKQCVITFSSATAPWVRLPAGSDLVVRERGDCLVVDLMPTSGMSAATADRRALDQALNIAP